MGGVSFFVNFLISKGHGNYGFNSQGPYTTFFAWVDFLGLQMPGIMYEFYHLKVIKGFYFCLCISRSQRLGTAARKIAREALATSKVASLGSFISHISALEGILSWDSSVTFIGVVNMMACKCTINDRTVTPNACLSWPDFLALPL